jgi:hypothetical protein
LANLQLVSTLYQEILEAQSHDQEMKKIKKRIDGDVETKFNLRDGLLYFLNRLYVPNNLLIKQRILSEAHQAKYSIHPRSIKTYMDPKKIFWWE